VNRIPYAAKKTNRGREAAWETALRQAKLEYVRPYAMRHSFAGWGLTLIDGPKSPRVADGPQQKEDDL